MQIEVGAILEGKVTAIKEYGAFVALAPDYKKSGMVHISEVSGHYVEKIEKELSLQQTVRVKVLSIDEKGKIALSIKAVESQPEKAAPTRRETPKTPPAVTNAAPPVYTAYTPPKRESAQKGEPKDAFEEMMSRFKTRSDEKISDLRKNVDNHRGSGGFSRRGNKKF